MIRHCVVQLSIHFLSLFITLANKHHRNVWAYKRKGPKQQFRVDSLAAGLIFLLSLVTVLQLPVHDLTNHRSGHQAEQLQHAEDGGVQTHCKRDQNEDQMASDKTKKTINARHNPK